MPILSHGPIVEKRLSPRERSEPEAVLRMRREGEILEKLSALGVTPRLVARGEDERGPWHRTERVALPTLATRPVFDGTLVQASFAALARIHGACDALGPLAIVHADLSPGNVALGEGGVGVAQVCILDFDLAWFRDGHPPADGSFRGTIATAAPELARGERPTVQSDLFALAATWLGAWRGRPAREGPSYAALIALAAETPLDVPPELGPALAACLAHEPAGRPASAEEVVAALTASPIARKRGR